MPHYAKPEIGYGDPIAQPKPAKGFQPLPPRPAGHLKTTLAEVAPRIAASLPKNGPLFFHAVGDTGGVDGDEVERRIAEAMQLQIKNAKPNETPGFFYLLGDVVYKHGNPDDYRDQFYKPFKRYDAPIVAIPGNHDGYGRQKVPDSSLDGWKLNFLGGLPEADWFPYRDPMRLPYVYWVLETEWVNIIGLYSNTEGFLDEPSGGQPQRQWLAKQLAATPEDRAIIIAVHHPPYSLDDDHHGSPAIGEAIDWAAAEAKRWPDMVLSGHVHSYQRFTRRLGNREIPYVVAGAGGRANKRSRLASLMEWPGEAPIKVPFKTKPRDATLDVELVAADWTDPGFLLLSVDRTELRCTYYRVPFDESQPPEWQDRISLNLSTHQITNIN